MNLTLPSALSLTAVLLVTSAAAFTLDFGMISARTPVPGSPEELRLTVPGYGDVRLQSALGSDLVIDKYGDVMAVNFGNYETLVVTFLGGRVDADPGYTQTSVARSSVFAVQGIDLNVYEITYFGQNAAVTAIHFVPEPSMLLFVASGLLALIRRR